MYHKKQNDDGELIIEGYDTTVAKSDFQFVKVRDERQTIHWETTMRSLSSGDNLQISDVAYYPTIFDSGSSFLTLPQTVINKIIAQIKTQTNSELYKMEKEGIYACSCAFRYQLDDIVFHFSAASFTMPVPLHM